MSIQTVELSGERYVILPEREFLQIQRGVSGVATSPTHPSAPGESRFKEVIPVQTDGIPASEMLMQDRE